jgi:hypothetical protein
MQRDCSDLLLESSHHGDQIKRDLCLFLGTRIRVHGEWICCINYKKV